MTCASEFACMFKARYKCQVIIIIIITCTVFIGVNKFVCIYYLIRVAAYKSERAVSISVDQTTAVYTAKDNAVKLYMQVDNGLHSPGLNSDYNKVGIALSINLDSYQARALKQLIWHWFDYGFRCLQTRFKFKSN